MNKQEKSTDESSPFMFIMFLTLISLIIAGTFILPKPEHKTSASYIEESEQNDSTYYKRRSNYFIHQNVVIPAAMRTVRVHH